MSARSPGFVWFLLPFAGACASQPTVVPQPTVAVSAVETPPAPVTAPPPAPPATASPAVDDPPERFACLDRCDIAWLSGCGRTEQDRAQVIDRLGECRAEEESRERRVAYEDAMLKVASRDGAPSAAIVEHLVRIGIVSRGQAQTLSRASHRERCRLKRGSAEGTLELDCRTSGACVGACYRQYFVEIFRVEAAGLRLLRREEQHLDNGSCGCCMGF